MINAILEDTLPSSLRSLDRSSSHFSDAGQVWKSNAQFFKVAFKIYFKVLLCENCGN